MEENTNNRGFMIPKSFLSQLGEYTQGYLLVVCNERGDLYVHEAFDNPVIKIGLIKFADLHVTASIDHMQNTALLVEEENEFIEIERANRDAEDDDEDEDEDDDEEGENNFS